MPRGRTTQAILGGLMVLAMAAPHVAAQDAYDREPYEGATPQAVPGEDLKEYNLGTVPGYGREAYPDVMPGYGAELGVAPPPTGMELFRQYPHPGPQWAATHGYPNYDYPSHLFGVWFRSKAWGLRKTERCAIPDPWRPRGFGNLFARPTTPNRMDYHRPILIDPHTAYGPSYYVRMPNPNCCVRTVDGHVIYLDSRAREWQLEEELRRQTQVRIR